MDSDFALGLVVQPQDLVKQSIIAFCQKYEDSEKQIVFKSTVKKDQKSFQVKITNTTADKGSNSVQWNNRNG